MGKIYFYKMTVDNLGAPHVRDGLLSLAICKPQIRRGAEKGDFIFGFGGAPLQSGRLIYAAVVTETLERGEYYKNYGNRADAIYSWKNGDLRLKARALYHSDGSGRKSDIGNEPDFPKARVLISDDYRYLGARGDDSYAKECPNLVQRLSELRIAC